MLFLLAAALTVGGFAAFWIATQMRGDGANLLILMAAGSLCACLFAWGLAWGRYLWGS